MYGPCTRPVYTTHVHDCVRRRVHGAYTARTRDVHTAVYGPCTWPCTRHVYGRVHVSTCTRPCYTAVYGPSTRPKTAAYTAVHGHVTCRVYVSVRALSARVHGSVRAVCTAVFGRVHWPCTLLFLAVYIARTRPCNGPSTRPLHGRVQGQSGPCIRQVGLSGHVHVSRRHTTAVLRLVYAAVCTARVDEHVHGSVFDVYTTVYMACYGRVHGPWP